MSVVKSREDPGFKEKRWGEKEVSYLLYGQQSANLSLALQQLFYKYYGVGHPIVKEDVQFLAYLRLRAWEMGNRRKTNDQATNLFILDDVLTAKLLCRKSMPLHVPNGNCEYYLGDRCWRQLAGEARIPLNSLLSISPHISPSTL
ncbi:hypothetical protein GIB67_003141 [Kingdonia uniflora]|uniref:Uncharacterized protein n=1 Tax=Kingdonia uniflora TaxID=39325 RepID=A0A7J7N616_9MAGN|nr:hypothetical protein GIB67_003141 [Kingdonia uniflora]